MWTILKVSWKSDKSLHKKNIGEIWGILIEITLKIVFLKAKLKNGVIITIF